MMLRRVGALACVFVLGACSDNGGDGPRRSATPPCPTNLQEVATQVFEPSCVRAGCHGSGDKAGGLDLQTSQLELELLGHEAALCSGETRVVPGDAEASLLIAKLRGTTNCGVRMPIDDPLAAETIDCIAEWIDGLDVSSVCETCGGTACVDLLTDEQHCGSCGETCVSSATCVDGGCACPADLEACGGGCVDLNADSENCGACGSSCGDLFCLQGTCVSDCGEFSECGGTCVDMTTDPLHCGACGNACGPGASCFDGQCQCGATTVSFADDVQRIFDSSDASCASMGCHDGGPGPGGQGGATSLDLTRGNAYQSLLDTTTRCGAVVMPGDPGGSLLIGKLTGTELCMGSQMPKGDPPLPAGLIDTIATWICQGAENN